MAKKIPTFPPDEETRLRSVHASGLLRSGQDERFDRLTRLARQVFDVPIAMVTLADEDRLYVKSCDGFSPPQYVPREDSFCGHAILSPDPLIVQDASKDERFYDNSNVTQEPYVRFYAGCPVMLPDGATAGTFCLIDHKPREFSPQELVALKDLAAIVEDEFAVLDAASSDELTGLLNRRGIKLLADYSLVSSQRRGEPLSVAFIDLDGFKQINDTWGHEEGDRALIAMANLMKAAFRDTDVLSRPGGDEFVIIFLDTEEAGAFIALEYLSEQVADFNRHSGNPWTLNYSVGLVQYNELEHATMADIIQHADQQMYQVKAEHKLKQIR